MQPMPGRGGQTACARGVLSSIYNGLAAQRLRRALISTFKDLALQGTKRAAREAQMILVVALQARLVLEAPPWPPPLSGAFGNVQRVCLAQSQGPFTARKSLTNNEALAIFLKIGWVNCCAIRG